MDTHIKLASYKVVWIIKIQLLENSGLVLGKIIFQIKVCIS